MVTTPFSCAFCRAGRIAFSSTGQNRMASTPLVRRSSMSAACLVGLNAASVTVISLISGCSDASYLIDWPVKLIQALLR
jgi:hypothetical protein